MEKVENQIRKIESNFPTLKPFKFGTTQIDYESLTREEQALFEKIAELDKQGRKIPDALKRESCHVLAVRVFDLFLTYIESVYLENSLEKAVFVTRFIKWLDETLDLIEKQRAEFKQLEAQGEGEELPEEEV